MRVETSVLALGSVLLTFGSATAQIGVEPGDLTDPERREHIRERARAKVRAKVEATVQRRRDQRKEEHARQLEEQRYGR